MALTVTVSPESSSIEPNASRAFLCTVTGTTNTSCTWQVKESGGGAITETGAYTASANAGTYHIIATSVADPTATGTATVTVVPQVIGTCANLPAAGTWQNITPPTLGYAQWCAPYSGTCPEPGKSANGQIGTYGTNAFVLVPSNAGTVYLGTSSLGIWKSTDCGSTWVHINTGKNGDVLDAGRNWTMVADPADSQVLYTVAGYGQGGIYKSVNGGVDWVQLLPQSILDMTGGAFMEKITMDPTNNKHLLAGFHTDCTGTALPGAATDTMGWGCFVESADAGATWTLTTSASAWSGLDGPGQTMIDSKTWFYATNGPYGLWRTTTGGVSANGKPAWTQVYSGGVNGSVYVAKNGTYYAGGNNIIWSQDQGLTWAVIPNSPNVGSINGSTPMVDDGTKLYVGSNSAQYFTLPDATPGGPLTMISSTPSIPQSSAGEESPAAYLDYDAAHHIIYSSNLDGGFWRLVTK